MQVVFCGVRGSTPAPGEAYVRYGGNTSCVAVAPDDGPVSLVLDAGTGIRAVTGLLGGAPFRGDVLITHLHWDHVTGLPFFTAADRPDARTTVHLPATGDAEAFDVLERLHSPPYFPIGLAGLRGEWSFRGMAAGWRRVGDWDVLARPLPHGGGDTLGYRITDGRATVAYVTDHGPASLDDRHDDVLALAEGADLLIHDAQHLASEWAAVKHFGHAPHEYALELGRACGARHVVLFHHAPTRGDDELDRLGRALPPWASLAREGTRLTV